MQSDGSLYVPTAPLHWLSGSHRPRREIDWFVEPTKALRPRVPGEQVTRNPQGWPKIRKLARQLY